MQLTRCAIVPPNLKHVTFYTDFYKSDIILDISWDQLAALVQVISFFLTSSEHPPVMCGARKEGPLKNVISSLVYRCESLLRSFETCVLL